MEMGLYKYIKVWLKSPSHDMQVINRISLVNEK